jgi:hypothetical protein
MAKMKHQHVLPIGPKGEGRKWQCLMPTWCPALPMTKAESEQTILEAIDDDQQQR